MEAILDKLRLSWYDNLGRRAQLKPPERLRLCPRAFFLSWRG
jgi:phytoene synthase